MTSNTRRRQAGEGTIAEYQTGAGTRYLIKVTVTLPDGTRKPVLRRGFRTRKDAAAGIRALITHSEKPGGLVEPSKVTVGAYLDEWLAGLRLAPSTTASYDKNVRLHIKPRIGAMRLRDLTGVRLSAVYRELERTGRADGTGGLSARTTRYVATILHKALKDAVRSGLIPVNPADVADKPSVRAARSPEMVTWNGQELGRFIRWTAENADAEQRTAWLLLVATGMRRGELLALRWQDCDFDAGAISIRRSVGTVRSKGNPQQMVEGTPKNGKARVVDIDPATVAMLRAHRAGRAALGFTLARGESLIFGDINGGYRLPESFSRYFRETVARCIRDEVARDPLPTIHLHSLRHTAATLLLAAGVHPKVVQERLGHQTIGITLDVYSHALPTLQRDAADALGAIVHGGLSCGDVAIGSGGSLSRPSSPRG